MLVPIISLKEKETTTMNMEFYRKLPTPKELKAVSYTHLIYRKYVGAILGQLLQKVKAKMSRG